MIFISSSIIEDRLKALCRALDKDSTGAKPQPGKIMVYSGPQPSAPNGALTADNIKLVELILPLNTAGTFSSPALVINPPVGNSQVLADGTLSWARLTSGDGTWCLDCHVGKTGDKAPIIFKVSSLQVFAGGMVGVESMRALEV